MGDPVTAYDPRTGKSSTQTVQHVWVNHDHDLLDVTLHADGYDGTATQSSTTDKAQEVATKAHGSQAPPPPSLSPSQDETIHTTEQHPWLTSDRGWVKAGALRVGEHVVELDGHTATIAALAVHPGAADYYNLTVSQLHTYAVGASQAVVHNFDCSNETLNVLAKAAADTLRYKTGAKGIVVAYVKIGGRMFASLNEEAWSSIGMDVAKEVLGKVGGEDVEILDSIAQRNLVKWAVGHAHAEDYIADYMLQHGGDLEAIGTSWFRNGSHFCPVCRARLGL